MERVASEVDGSHLEIGNLDAFGIFLFVQPGAHLEAGICCRRGDQLDDRAIATQWLSPPVDGDEGEETRKKSSRSVAIMTQLFMDGPVVAKRSLGTVARRKS